LPGFVHMLHLHTGREMKEEVEKDGLRAILDLGPVPMTLFFGRALLRAYRRNSMSLFSGRLAEEDSTQKEGPYSCGRMVG
jgi:hypothetical protein